MRVQTEQARPTATIPVGAAQRFLGDLAAAGGDLNTEVANRLRGQVSVAQLKGADEIDVEAAILQALLQGTEEPTPQIPLPEHRSRIEPSVSDDDDPEVEDSIDHLVDLVIDLR